MKKLIYLALALIMPCAAMAQKSGSRFILTPRVGATVSDFSGSTNSEHYSPKGGFIAGADIEYRISKTFGVSAGVYYSMQGAKENSAVLATFTDLPEPGIVYDDPYTISLKTAIGKGAHIDFDRNGTPSYIYITDFKDDFRYLSIPVMAKVHVWNGLSVNLGIQWDQLLSAHVKAKEEWKTKGEILFDDFDKNIKTHVHSASVAIPVGLSYSYKNIELDARYMWGLTKIDNTNASKDKDIKNSTFAITLGYNFHL